VSLGRHWGNTGVAHLGLAPESLRLWPCKHVTLLSSNAWDLGSNFQERHWVGARVWLLVA
jgi:hypothetical protein